MHAAKSRKLQLDPPQSDVWDRDLGYMWMWAKNRGWLTDSMASYGGGNANKQNTILSRSDSLHKSDNVKAELDGHRGGLLKVCVAPEVEQSVRTLKKEAADTKLQYKSPHTHTTILQYVNTSSLVPNWLLETPALTFSFIVFSIFSLITFAKTIFNTVIWLYNDSAISQKYLLF